MLNNFHNKELGQKGESLAKEFLVENGYKIIATNVKTSYKEIDIIATKDQEIIFVEVKTRSNPNFQSAEDSLTPQKIRHLQKAISIYLSNNYYDLEPRADLISIDFDKNKKIANIKHYPDII